MFDFWFVAIVYLQHVWWFESQFDVLFLVHVTVFKLYNAFLFNVVQRVSSFSADQHADMGYASAYASELVAMQRARAAARRDIPRLIGLLRSPVAGVQEAAARALWGLSELRRRALANAVHVAASFVALATRVLADSRPLNLLFPLLFPSRAKRATAVQSISC